MALTELQKSLAFDANKSLKTEIKSFTSSASKGGLCAPSITAYKSLVAIVNTIVVPVDIFQKEIKNALEGNDVENCLKSATEIMDIVGNGLGKANLQIDKSTIQSLNLFSKVCLDFNDILPNAMKSFLDKAMDKIDYEKFLMMPPEMEAMIENVTKMLISNKLSKAFGEVINSVFTPMEMYSNFIKDTEVLTYIKRLQKMERCLTNPETCARPREEFYYPGTKKYNSQYYLELLKINTKGEVQLKKLNSSFASFEGKMGKTIKKISALKKSPFK